MGKKQQYHNENESKLGSADYKKENYVREEEDTTMHHFLNKLASVNKEKKEEIIICNNVKYDDCIRSGEYVKLNIAFDKIERSSI